MKRLAASGMTLIELMIVISIIGIMVATMAPLMGGVNANSRERSVVEQFLQDYDWARGRGASGAAASLVLNKDCTWTSTTGSPDDPAHSLSAATLGTNAPGLTCAGVSLALPATFTFTGQGFSSATGTVTFTGSKGGSWPLQVLFSGSVVRLTGAS